MYNILIEKIKKVVDLTLINSVHITEDFTKISDESKNKTPFMQSFISKVDTTIKDDKIFNKYTVRNLLFVGLDKSKFDLSIDESNDVKTTIDQLITSFVYKMYLELDCSAISTNVDVPIEVNGYEVWLFDYQVELLNTTCKC
jgi:hypothetical protein